jgi:hypothetical protein
MTADDTLLTSDNHALLLIDHQYLAVACRAHARQRHYRQRGGFGQRLRWEWQLLGLKEGTAEMQSF